jgi:hypothetical protein
MTLLDPEETVELGTSTDADRVELLAPEDILDQSPSLAYARISKAKKTALESDMIKRMKD